MKRRRMPMKLKDFEKFVDYYAKQSEVEEELVKALASTFTDDMLFTTKFADNLRKCIEILFINEYGKEAYDTFTWWLYELPMMVERDTLNGKTADYMFEKDGTPIPIKTVKNLWAYLECCKK